MDIGPALLIGFGWLVINAHPEGGEQAADGLARRAASARPRLRHDSGAPERRRFRARGQGRSRRSRGADATQREGSQLERFSGSWAARSSRARGPLGRAPDRRLPPAEEVEERGSLEVTPGGAEPRSAIPSGRARVEVDQDDEAERIVARRIAAAEAQGKPLTKADHRAFDERIRQEAADKTATRATRRASCGMRWCGGRSSGRRCRCGGRGRSGRRSYAERHPALGIGEVG